MKICWAGPQLVFTFENWFFRHRVCYEYNRLPARPGYMSCQAKILGLLVSGQPHSDSFGNFLNRLAFIVLYLPLWCEMYVIIISEKMWVDWRELKKKRSGEYFWHKWSQVRVLITENVLFTLMAPKFRKDRNLYRKITMEEKISFLKEPLHFKKHVH